MQNLYSFETSSPTLHHLDYDASTLTRAIVYLCSIDCVDSVQEKNLSDCIVQQHHTHELYFAASHTHTHLQQNTHKIRNYIFPFLKIFSQYVLPGLTLQRCAIACAVDCGMFEFNKVYNACIFYKERNYDIGITVSSDTDWTWAYKRRHSKHRVQAVPCLYLYIVTRRSSERKLTTEATSPK